MSKTETTINNLKINTGTYANIQANISSIGDNELVFTDDKNIPIPADPVGVADSVDKDKVIKVNASGQYELGTAGADLEFVTYDTTTFAQVSTIIAANKLAICKYNGLWYRYDRTTGNIGTRYHVFVASAGISLNIADVYELDNTWDNTDIYLQYELNTSSVLDGTINKVIGFNTQGEIIKGDAPSGGSTGITVGDKLRSLYVNNNVGKDRLNTLLASLTYNDNLYISEEVQIPCVHNIIAGTGYLCNITTIVYQYIYAIDLNKLGTAVGISGCDGYLLASAMKEGLNPIYISAWNAADTQLAQAMGINIDSAGFKTKYIDMLLSYTGGEIPSGYEQQYYLYPAYAELSYVDSDFTLLNELFSKTPGTFDGQFVTKEYADSINKINIGDNIKGIYLNKNIGKNRLNTALANLSYTDSYTVQTQGGQTMVLNNVAHNLLVGDTIVNNINYYTSDEFLLVLDLNTFASQIGISGCTGYAICEYTYAGIPYILYVSDWNSANDQLAQTFGLPVSSAGFVVDYVDIVQTFLGSSTINEAYPNYGAVTAKDSAFTLFDELFTKYPTTFGGHFTTKEYVDSQNPMTTAGDIIYGGASGTPTRLAKGTAGQVLTMNSGATAPEWQTPSGGGGTQLYRHTISDINPTVGSISIQIINTDSSIYTTVTDIINALTINKVIAYYNGYCILSEAPDPMGTSIEVTYILMGQITTATFDSMSGKSDTVTAL